MKEKNNMNWIRMRDLAYEESLGIEQEFNKKYSSLPRESKTLYSEIRNKQGSRLPRLGYNKTVYLRTVNAMIKNKKDEVGGLELLEFFDNFKDKLVVDDGTPIRTLTENITYCFC